MDYIYDSTNKFYKATPKDHPKDRIEIEIGDSKDPTTFQPQLKIMRWDNEVNFSLRLLVDSIPGVQSQTSSNGIIEYTKGQWKARFYDKPELDEGGYEFEIEMPKKPPVNSLTFSINTKDLEYYFQPELTQDEISRGVSRPNNIIGSYAVYHKTKGKLNNALEKDYKTGKAFHIFRPHCVDANGNETWADLFVDGQAGTLTITVDQTWLRNAIYPVIIDPTFGYTTFGASSAGLNTGYWYSTTCTPVNGDGLLDTIFAGWLASDAADNMKAVAVLKGDLNILANGVSNITSKSTTVGWSWTANNYSTKPSLTTATDYLFGVIPDDNISLYYDSGDANNAYYDTTNNYGTPTNPTDATGEAKRYSIYGLYHPNDISVGTYEELFLGGSANWVCPTGVTSVNVKAYGGGGGGGAVSGTGSGGGGGAGGVYANAEVNVTAGGTYPVVVGNGGTYAYSGGGGNGGVGGSSWFGAVGSVYAPGGAFGTGSTSNSVGCGGGVGGTTGAIGTLVYAGGNGANGVANTSSGGGGGGAGTAGVGGNASGTAGGTASPPGGGGGRGYTSSAAGAKGTAYGGGGGGGYASSATDRSGGQGGYGAVVLRYVVSAAAGGLNIASWKSLLGVGQG